MSIRLKKAFLGSRLVDRIRGREQLFGGGDQFPIPTRYKISVWGGGPVPPPPTLNFRPGGGPVPLSPPPPPPTRGRPYGRWAGPIDLFPISYWPISSLIFHVTCVADSITNGDHKESRPRTWKINGKTGQWEIGQKINFSNPPTVRSTSLLPRNAYFKTDYSCGRE